MRALLAYLAVEGGQPHSRERLAGLLWPDQPERLARTNLRSALAKLRTTIHDREAAPAFLAITRDTLQLNPVSETWIDATALTRLVETSRLLTRQSASRPVSQLEKAVALYRGPFLEGFSLPDSAPFEEWALFERERLHRLAMDALHRLAEAHQARGDLDRALAHAWRQLELDPA